jgi:uncharacterized protein with NAD-binding domain and iron-sulfur cluster
MRSSLHSAQGATGPDEEHDMAQVTIVGAGIAGLTAALRLLERGFSVTILEQNAFVGGKLGAHQSPIGSDYHEHSYHMYLNWYHNFWKIMEDINVRDRFVAQSTCNYLRRDRIGEIIELCDVGSVASALPNMFSGLTAPADMFLYAYSLVDLLGTPPRHAHLSHTSLYGFMNARPYMTRRAFELHGQTLAKAFACPTELTSTHSYRNFINYGFRSPSPMVWLLGGNTQENLFAPLVSHLHKIARQNGARLQLNILSKVTKLQLDHGRVRGLHIQQLDTSPSVDKVAQRIPTPSISREQPVDGAVILAVPPFALADLVDHEVFAHAPSLGNVRKLHCQPMASVDVYFRRKLANIPKGITILLDSPYQVTFLDTSQLWEPVRRGDVTSLDVVLSDYQVLAAYQTASDQQKLLEYVLGELKHYIEFCHDNSSVDPEKKNDDVDRARCYLQTNIDEPLFTNQVDSRHNRPGTTCSIPNLFIAGDYCRTVIDITTIEAAVVSGLMAAEAVRRQAGIGTEIPIRAPDTYPQLLLSAMKALGMPAAYATKAFTVMSEMMYAGYKEYFPND